MSIPLSGYYLLLFALTFLGGYVPIVYKYWKGRYIGLLLTFSAAFLLGITFLHLIPDALEHLGTYSGILLLAGFFVQQIVQQFTQGFEHGHHHTHDHHHTHNYQKNENGEALFWPVFLGLSIHAFSEGLPLGIHYTDAATLPALVLAIGLHKIPEAMLVIALYRATGHSKWKSIFVLILFAAITPLSAVIALVLGNYFSIVSVVLQWCIPFIAGIFIQIATTVFYENSSQEHVLKWQKWLMVLLGAGVAMISLL